MRQSVTPLLAALLAVLPPVAAAQSDSCLASSSFSLPLDLTVADDTRFAIVNFCNVLGSLTVAPRGELAVSGTLNLLPWTPVDIWGRASVTGTGSINVANRLTVQAGGSLTLADSAGLTVGGLFVNAGSFQLPSGPGSGSFLVSGTFVNAVGGQATFSGKAPDFLGGGTIVNHGTLTLDQGFELVLYDPSTQPTTWAFMPGSTLINRTLITTLDDTRPLVVIGTLQNEGRVEFGTLNVASNGVFVNLGAPLDTVAQIDIFGLYRNGVADRIGGPGRPDLKLEAGSTYENLSKLQTAPGYALQVPLDARWVNTGTMTLGDPGTFGPAWSALTVGGTLENHGLIVVAPGARVTLASGSHYDFSNGELQFAGQNTLVLQVDYGFGGAQAGVLSFPGFDASTIDNQAHLSNLPANILQLNGALLNRNSFANLGTLMLDSTTQAPSSNLGSFVNAAGGTLLLRGMLGNQGSIDNQGQFSIRGSGNLRNDATVSNAGTFVVERNSDGYGGIATVTGSGSYRQDSPGATTRIDGDVAQRLLVFTGDDTSVLSGTGTIHGQVLVDGALLAPGVFNGVQVGSLMRTRSAAGAIATGVLTLDGDLTFNAGTLLFGVAGDAAFDVLHVTGHASFSGGTLVLQFADGYLPGAGAHWLLLAADGGSSGLSTLVLRSTGLPSGYGFSIEPGAGLMVSVAQVAAVPEPRTAWLLAAGLAALARRRRRPPPFRGVVTEFRDKAAGPASEHPRWTARAWPQGERTMRKIFTVVLATLPLAAAADVDHCPDTSTFLPTGLVVTAKTVFSVVNFCVVNNSLTVETDGELQVLGTLLAGSFDSLDIAGKASASGSGSITSAGPINIRQGGQFYLDDPASLVIQVGGTLTNGGSFELSPYTGTGLFSIQGDFVNDAGGKALFSGTRNFDLGGTLTNRGTLTVANGFQLLLDPSRVVLDPAGTLVNRSFVSVGTDWTVPLSVNGTWQNEGLIDGGIISVARQGRFISNVADVDGNPFFQGWQIDNRGIYDNNIEMVLGVAGAPVLNLYAGSTFNNNATLKLFNTNELAVPLDARFVNKGTLVVSDLDFIATGGLVSVAGRLENTGTIVIHGGGQLTLDTGSSYDFTNGSIVLNGGGTLLLRVDMTWGDPQAGTLAYLDGIQAGTVVNEARLVNAAGHFQQVNGLFVNRRQFDNQGNLLLQDYLMGSRNESGATINNADGASFVLGMGQFTNEGTLVNAGQFQVVGQAELVNNGTINSQGIFLIEAGPLGHVIGSGRFVQSGLHAITHLAGEMTQSRVSVDGGGVLYGEGTLHGDLFVDGSRIDAGPYHGILVTGSMAARKGLRSASGASAEGTALTIDGNLSFVDSILAFGIYGDGQSDRLHVTGHASFSSGVLLLVFADGYRPAQGTQWLLLTADAGSGGLATLTPSTSGLPAGYGFSVSLDDAGLRVTVDQVAAVPEPQAAWLLAAGLLALAARRSRRPLR